MNNTKKGFTQRVFGALVVVLACLVLRSSGIHPVSPTFEAVASTTPKPINSSARDIATLPAHRAISLDIASVTPLESTKDTNVNKPSFTAYDVDLFPELQAYLWEQCRSYGLDFALVLALIEVESGYRSHVISPTEDYGLMQINKVNHPRLAEKLGTTDFLNPEDNMAAGAFMLAEIFEKEQDEHRALMVYNCGRAGAKRLWKKGIEKTTYSEKVVKVRDKIEERK